MQGNERKNETSREGKARLHLLFFFKGASEKARREVKENKRKLQQFEMTGGDEDREAILRTHGGRRRADKRKWELKKNSA